MLYLLAGLFQSGLKVEDRASDDFLRVAIAQKSSFVCNNFLNFVASNFLSCTTFICDILLELELSMYYRYVIIA